MTTATGSSAEGDKGNAGPDAGTANNGQTTTTPPAGGNNGPDNGKPAEGSDQGPETEEQKAKRHARWWESQAEKWKKDAETAQGKLKASEDAAQSDAEKAITKAREEGKTEAEKAWRSRYEGERRTAEARRVLSGVAIEPDLLLPHLSLSEITVADDGTVDEGALAAAVDKLMDKYPAQKKDAKKAAGGMDMNYRRTSATSNTGSMESGAALYEQRHGKKKDAATT